MALALSSSYLVLDDLGYELNGATAKLRLASTVACAGVPVFSGNGTCGVARDSL